MFKDMANKATSSKDVLCLATNHSDSYGVRNVHWSCKDEIYQNGVLMDVIESSNIVVNDCSKLLAGLVSGKIANGVQYWAIGSGAKAWDDQWGTASPPAPSPADTKLVAEFYRKAVPASAIKFVDVNGNDLPDSTFSNRIKITIVVSENEGNGDWREFGLYGGTATATKDSGILIDHKLHKILSKTTDISVTRSIVLEF